MKNNEIELWLRQAAEAEAPDLLDGIMKGIEEGRGRDQNISIIQGDFRRKKKKGLALGSAAAALAMLLGAGFYFSYNYSVDSLIGIDVNPSLELEVSKRERVISARALNGDAETVLSGMDLKNVDLDVAVNAIIGSMLQNGYLSADGNSIFVTVENDDENKGQVLSDSLMQQINAALSSNDINGSVVGAAYGKDASVQSIADTYGISYGKASVASAAVANNPELKIEQAVKMSVSQLWSYAYPDSLEKLSAEAAKTAALKAAGVQQAEFEKAELYEKQGTYIYNVIMTAGGVRYTCEIEAYTGEVLALYSQSAAQGHVSGGQTNASGGIDEQAALKIAYQDAGVSASDVKLVKCELDYDDGRQEYEIEFYFSGREYDYEIDAESGAILGREVDYDSDDWFTWDFTGRNESGQNAQGGSQGQGSSQSGSQGSSQGQGSSQSGSQGSSQGQSGVIDKNRALEAAFAHAGVSSSDVYDLECEYDYDDGRGEYEIEFSCGGWEYEYKIDAQSGQVLEWEKDD